MKVTREKTENSQAYLTIEVEPAEVEAELGKSYQRLVRKANIPGFRKGKAPRAILERHVGKAALLEDALEYLIPRAYEDAVKEEKLEAIARPTVEITTTEPVVFKATVPLKPVVELGDYKSIRVAPEETKYTEEDVNHTLEHLQHNHATFEPVEREVRLDDSIVMDIESTIDGQSFINQKGVEYRVVAGFDGPAPGFPEQLVGMKRGEQKEFKIKYPEDHSRTELAGKEATFKVTISEIKQEVIPELNDDFAKQVDAELKDFAALKERIGTNLKRQAEEKTRKDHENKTVEALVSQTKIEFPPVLVDIEIDRMIEDFRRRFGIEDFGAYLESIKKTPEAFQEELKPEAGNRVKRALALGKLAEAEKIAVSEAEVDEEIKKVAQGREEGKEKLIELLNAPQSRESIKDLLTARKTIQRLVEIASPAPEAQQAPEAAT